MRVEVAVLGSPVPNKPYVFFCGRKATLKLKHLVLPLFIVQELCESRGAPSLISLMDSVD